MVLWILVSADTVVSMGTVVVAVMGAIKVRRFIDTSPMGAMLGRGGRK